MSLINVVVFCAIGTNRFTLEKRSVLMPKPGETLNYVFDILPNAVVEGYSVTDLTTGDVVSGGMAQAFSNSGGTYTVEVSGDFVWPSTYKAKYRRDRRQSSARNFRHHKAGTWTRIRT